MSFDSAKRLRSAEELAASPPIFPSPMLDRLTRAHPATPAVVFDPPSAFSASLPSVIWVHRRHCWAGAVATSSGRSANTGDTAPFFISSPNRGWARGCTG